jgi:hypothetical protein
MQEGRENIQSRAIDEFKRIETDLLLVALAQECNEEYIGITYYSKEFGIVLCLYDNDERRFVMLKWCNETIDL